MGRVEHWCSSYRPKFVFPVFPRFLWECHNISTIPYFQRPSSVGSRTGAHTLGRGFPNRLFRLPVGFTVSAIATLPTPAPTNATCGFPALRFPVNFTQRFMWPIELAALLSPVVSHPVVNKDSKSLSWHARYSVTPFKIP